MNGLTALYILSVRTLYLSHLDGFSRVTCCDRYSLLISSRNPAGLFSSTLSNVRASAPPHVGFKLSASFNSCRAPWYRSIVLFVSSYDLSADDWGNPNSGPRCASWIRRVSTSSAFPSTLVYDGGLPLPFSTRRYSPSSINESPSLQSVHSEEDKQLSFNAGGRRSWSWLSMLRGIDIRTQGSSQFSSHFPSPTFPLHDSSLTKIPAVTSLSELQFPLDTLSALACVFERSSYNRRVVWARVGGGVGFKVPVRLRKANGRSILNLFTEKEDAWRAE